MPSTTDLLEGELTDLAQKAWVTLTGLSIKPSASTRRISAPYVACSVHIAGAWIGTITVGCQRASAHLLAATMYGAAHSHVSRDEMKAAVESLTRFIAAEIKPVLDRSANVRRPHATSSDNERPRSGDQPVRIRLLANASAVDVSVHRTDPSV